MKKLFLKSGLIIVSLFAMINTAEAKAVKNKDGSVRGYSLSGRASWHNYDKERNKRFYYRYGTNMVASRKYPCGTKIKVTNIKNGKSIIVTVGDWGPAKWTGRQLDLNKRAFAKIADVKTGEIRVKYQVLSIGKCRTHRH